MIGDIFWAYTKEVRYRLSVQAIAIVQGPSRSKDEVHMSTTRAGSSAARQQKQRHNLHRIECGPLRLGLFTSYCEGGDRLRVVESA